MSHDSLSNLFAPFHQPVRPRTYRVDSANLCAQVANGAEGHIFVSGACHIRTHAEADARHVLRNPERLLVTHPLRVYVEASRGVDRLPVNAIAYLILGLRVRGPVILLPPISH